LLSAVAISLSGVMAPGPITAATLATGIPTDWEELGSDNAEQELTLTLLGTGEDIFDQIEAAIERIEDGSYGRCTTCGEQIPKNQLDAIPYAADCMKCASQQEVGHGAEPHCGWRGR
jgi:RNA polymerase-binding transcription factor DksA